MSGDDDVVRASEVGEYTFCARAWWLHRVKGYRSANVAQLAQGSDRHRAHGRAVRASFLLRRVAAILLVLAVAALVAWLILAVGR